MKLVTFSHQNETRLGAWIVQGGKDFVLDLCSAQPSLPRDILAFLDAGKPAMELARRACAAPEAQSLVRAADVTLLAPVPRPGKLICIGHNYPGHSGGVTPTRPDIFGKFSNVVIGPYQPIVIPPETSKVDYEAELAVVIGRRARRIPQERALEAVAGYTIFNDVTARDIQKWQSQWMFGKTPDTFGPMGPALVTTDEIPDPGVLDLTLWVNDVQRQHANTSELYFSAPFLIAYLSAIMTLEPGDLIATGSPSGTAQWLKPPAFMQPGDVVRVRIEKIGEIANPLVAERVEP